MSTAVDSGAGPAAAPAFEQTLAQLESLVAQLESGDLPLDVALRTFEQGVRLTRECQAALSAAQQRVQLLLQRGETVVLEEFDTASIERPPGTASTLAAGPTVSDSDPDL
ncbi:MAG TPA: exodeoxyribonuclease VII small subunit [Steroidobacteraceae bacterium]|nr:exodeoxyribonuclease VII small subunit [Steroidobacteraceae bacterium]